MSGAETVLCGGEGECVEFRGKKAFENLHYRGEEGYGTVTRSQAGRFARLEDRDYYGLFPDVRDVGGVE